MAKYIGLTIGPIYKTMMKAKKTRELWGASYLFSYLMKKIILEMKENHNAIFIIPYIGESIFLPGKEVGLFHDRLIARVENMTLEVLQSKIILPILNKTACEIVKKLGKEVSETDVTDFLKQYFSIYSCLVESDQPQNAINKEINLYLDILELQATYIPDTHSDYIMRFLERVNSSFLIEDAFETKRHDFYSIPEIALSEFSKELKEAGIFPLNKVIDDEDIYKEIRNLKEHQFNSNNFKTYHKYIAIVKADGDNLGKAIDGLDNKKGDAFKIFSKALFEFAQKAHETIQKNGGTTIFAGGDDLLFFFPVMYKKDSIKISVFDVCHQLGNCFRKKMVEALNSEDGLPTLSFGISISYYKFPMYEALETANDQLKRSKGFNGKNAVSFRYLKHSGASFDGTVSRNSEIYPHFRQLIMTDQKPEIPLKQQSDILTSVIHDIRQYSALLLEIGADLTRLRYFFENKYNKDIHEDYTDIGFFESVTAFIHEVCCTCKYSKEEKIHLIHSVLKLKKNLMGEEDK